MKKNLFLGFACFFMLSFCAPGSLAAQLIVATNTTWKALRSATPPPLGWTQLGFFDNSWPTAVEVSQATCLDPYHQIPASNWCGKSLPIWASRDSCSIPGDIVYFRQVFKLSDNSGCAFSLSVKADNTSEIYINGSYVGSTNNNWQQGDLFIIPSSYFNIGGKNVIAVKATDDGWTGWFSAILCRACD